MRYLEILKFQPERLEILKFHAERLEILKFQPGGLRYSNSSPKA